MALSKFERETIVNFNDGEDTAAIYTAQRRIITKLKNNQAATLLEEGVHDGSPWARFELPAAMISFRSVRRGATNSAFQSPEGRETGSGPSISTAEAA